MDISSGSKRYKSERGARERDRDDDERSERWLISYADLITTLMVFFLALYVLQLAKDNDHGLKALEQHAVKTRANGTAAGSDQQAAAKLALLSLLKPLSDKREIAVSEVKEGVEIAINAKVLFNSGDAHLLPESLDVLGQVARVLAGHSAQNILVEGHTDSVPISTSKYESNWELSAARAGAVVRFFVDKGIEPRRLAAIGRADTVPLVIGDDAAARAANRRVTILVQY
jgi:chemotaxis protein MotB